MMADVDVEDIECEDGKITVFTPHTEFAKARSALNEALGDIDFDVEEIQFIPRDTSPIPAEDEPMFEKEFTGLKPVGQLHLTGCLYDAGTGKSDQRPRLVTYHQAGTPGRAPRVQEPHAADR